MGFITIVCSKLTTITMWIFHILLLAVVGLANSECPGDGLFEEIHGSCYFFSSDSSLKHTWVDARSYCQNLGSSLGMKVGLAEVGNALAIMSDSLMMQKIAEKGWQTWLGASDAESENSWTWVTSGRSLSIMDPFWQDDQPNSTGGYAGDCLIAALLHEPYQPYHRAQFGDWPCSHEEAFVCQIF